VKSFNFTFINAQKINSRLKIFPMKTRELCFCVESSIWYGNHTSISTDISERWRAAYLKNTHFTNSGGSACVSLTREDTGCSVEEQLKISLSNTNTFPSGYQVTFTHRYICTHTYTIPDRLYTLCLFYVYIWATVCDIYTF
jgi:hypothetical protein